MVPGGPADLRGAGGDLSDAGLGRVFAIFNPASGRGRGARLIERYRSLLGEHVGDFDDGVTERAGAEADLADRAMGEGYDTVLAMGGDGTLSHVADRLVASERDVRFGVLPAGTGNDFGRNLGIDHRDPASAVRSVATGRVRRVDIGRVASPSRPDAHPDVEPGPRHFLNVVGFGFDVAVIDAAAGARFLRGELLYKITALQQLFLFPGFHADLEGGRGMRQSPPAPPSPAASATSAASPTAAAAAASAAAQGGASGTLMLTISNGRYFGGGFPIAPDAGVEDGLLHACHVGDASPLRRAILFNRAERGRHVGDARVTIESAGRFRVVLGDAPRFEIDGDVHVSSGAVVEVEVLPGRLAVLAG